MLIKLMGALQGNKSYIIAIATLMYAVGGFVSGHMSASEATNLVLYALGLGALRNAIK